MNVISEAKDKKDESRKRTDSNTSHDEDGKSVTSPRKTPGEQYYEDFIIEVLVLR